MAVTEFLTFVIGILMLAAAGVAGYLGGRDAAERKAAQTIADLRRAAMVLRSQRDRAVENNSRLARLVAAQTPRHPDTPEWMK